MRIKGLATWLASSLGVVAMFGVVVLINALAARVPGRVDLTAERAYTLSAGTRAILARLDTPVQIRFYCSRGDNRLSVPLKTYAQRVEDLLGEYRQAAHGQIEVHKLDPAPDSEAESSAKLDGIEPQPRLDGEPVYLGLSVSMLDQTETIPVLSPERERLLEYDLSRAVSRVAQTDKPVVGVMSPLPYAGQATNPMLTRMGQRGQPAWVFFAELKRDFTVKQIELTTDKIPDEVGVLVLIHPKGITPATEYALDQFVLRGGKLVAFLDPMAVLDRSAVNNQLGINTGGGSSLERLLKAWGLTFETGKVVADLDYVGRTREGRHPGLLLLNDRAINRDDVVTADARNLVLVLAGSFGGTPVAGVKESVLLHSSKNSQLVDAVSAQFGGERLIQDFVPSNTEYALAVRLSGKFPTAFPEGKPKAAPPAAGGKEAKPDSVPPAPGLKEAQADATVVLVGDSDFLQDPFAVQEVGAQPGGQRLILPSNGNLAFAQGIVEQLTGDSDLIAVRSRASRERPFTVVREIQARAESAYRSKIKELETSLTEAQTRLNELQRGKDAQGNQRFILSPEQQQEIANFRKKESDVKRQLKDERNKLRADIDSLEHRVWWVNIAGMPAVVTLVGLGLAAVRTRRRAAR